MKQRILAALMSICLFVGLFPVTALAAESTENNEFEVGSAEELAAAVDAINAAEHGEFLIRLTDDITALGTVEFTENETTICGQEHTLYLPGFATLAVRGPDTVLSLGTSDGMDTLTISGQNLRRTTAMLGCTGEAVLNMYPGVTIRDTVTQGMARGAGVCVYGTFNMHGGTITNCNNNVNYRPGIGGAVSLHAGTFNLYDGEITGNHIGGKDCYGYGAGVLVYANEGVDCTFNMRGGTISRNTTEGIDGWGTVCIMENDADAVFNMSGGVIEDNTAVIGGGVFNLNGTFNMTAGVIRNNTAADCADDLLTFSDHSTLFHPEDFGTLTSSGQKIDGWYQDGWRQGGVTTGILRWNQPVDPTGAGLDLTGNGEADKHPNEDGYYDLDNDGIHETHKDDNLISKLDVENIPPNVVMSLKAAHGLGDTGYTVSFDPNGGLGTMENVEAVSGDYTLPDCSFTAPDGKRFLTWAAGSPDGQRYTAGATCPVDSDLTFYAVWGNIDSTGGVVVPGGGGGGGGGNTRYTLHYESNGGTVYKDERYDRNTVVELTKTPTREGYRFTGWYADKELRDPITSIKMTSDKTVYAGWRAATVPDMLNGQDHFAYVVGYMDGTVGPLNNITRAEVATIFFRLLQDDVRDEHLTDINSFTDVTAEMWCNTPISTMAALGIVKGRTAELFDPDAPITRAEFAVICARFDTGLTDGASDFTDIGGHWAEAEIERAAALGWIRGYTDGTFGPERYITRAEAMTMINRVLCRIPETPDDLLEGMIVWPDNKPGDWYYLAVQEATNSHEFECKGETHERWTALTNDPDWKQYE